MINLIDTRNSSDTSSAIVTKSIVEGLREFGLPTAAGIIPMVDKDGNSFNCRGFQTSTCFISFSKKLVEALPDSDEVAIVDEILAHPSQYQFACKPGATWKNGRTIWVVTTNGSKLQTKSNAGDIARWKSLAGALLG